MGSGGRGEPWWVCHARDLAMADSDIENKREKYSYSHQPVTHWCLPLAAPRQKLCHIGKAACWKNHPHPQWWSRAGEGQGIDLRTSRPRPGTGNMLGSFSTFTTMTSPHLEPDHDESIPSRKSRLVGAPGRSSASCFHQLLDPTGAHLKSLFRWHPP